MKTYLRGGAKQVSEAVTEKGVGKFKNEMERIHSEAKAAIVKAVEPEFITFLCDNFNRVSADGKTLASAEELTNLVTALEYRFNEFLTIPRVRQQVMEQAS